MVFGTFNDSIIKEISSAIINMKASRQMAIILAFVALSELKFKQMPTVDEKSSELWILFILNARVNPEFV